MRGGKLYTDGKEYAIIIPCYFILTYSRRFSNFSRAWTPHEMRLEIGMSVEDPLGSVNFSLRTTDLYYNEVFNRN